MTAVRKQQEAIQWPDDLFYCGQIKYELDKGTPRWKVWFFFHVYLNFARFCYFKLGLPTIRVLNKDGSPGWLEDQTICLTKEEGDELVKDFPFGFVKRMPFRAQTPAEAYQYGEYGFPNSPVRERYEQDRREITGVETSSLVELHRAVKELRGTHT